MNFSTGHIDYLNRSYLDNSQIFINPDKYRGQYSYPHKSSLNLCQIISLCLPESIESQDQRTSFVDMLTGISGLDLSISYMVVGEATSINLFISTCSHGHQNHTRTSASPLKSLLKGSFPGIELKHLSGSDQVPSTSWPTLVQRLPHAALITGTPAILSAGICAGGMPVDRLIRALYGRRWAYVVLAQPMQIKALQDLSSYTLVELQAIANAERSANSGNEIARKYRELLNRFWKKLQTGKAQGMWQSVGYVLTEDLPTLLEAKAITKSILSGAIPSPDPIRLLDVGNVESAVAAFGLPEGQPAPGPGRIQYPSQYLSLLNSSELATMVHLPTQEMPGYFVKPKVQFDITSHQSSNRPGNLTIGQVTNHGESTGINYNLMPEMLTRHAMVVGTTGSGKTNSLFHLLGQLASQNIPFLVIEPAKTEYRTLLKHSDLDNSLQIFTLGEETLSPFRLNPFEVLPGVNLQTHIDHLKAVFNASFVMYAPMPYVLERCVNEIYEDKGWDLITNENWRGAHANAWPTLSDLYTKIGEVVDSLGYDTKLNQDIKAALKTRINSLRIGGKGQMLDTHSSLPIQALLSKPTILELQSIGDDGEKAFLMGLILMKLYEYYRAKGHQENSTLKHVTVVEEAHRLLKNVPFAYSAEMASMAGKAVETFSQILAEIRAYGEGVIVSEQIPSKLSSDIIKNTNLKIVHRLVAEEDRQLIGGTIGLTTDQSRWLGTCASGEAAIFSTGDDAPVRVQVPYAKQLGTAESGDIWAAMVAFHKQYAHYYSRFPWLNGSENLPQGYQKEALRISENREFQEIFAQYIMSLANSIEVYREGFPLVQQTIEKLAKRPGNPNLAPPAVLVHAIDTWVEQRGTQYGVEYDRLVPVKQQLTHVLLRIVYQSRQTTVSSDEQEQLIQCQRLLRETLASASYPYAGCSQVCANSICFYRHHAAPIVKDKRIYDLFVNALNRPEGQKWEEVKSACNIATRRLLLPQVPKSERNKVALCFGIQVGEAIPTLDDHLRKKLFDGMHQKIS